MSHPTVYAQSNDRHPWNITSDGDNICLFHVTSGDQTVLSRREAKDCFRLEKWPDTLERNITGRREWRFVARLIERFIKEAGTVRFPTKP